VVTTIEEALASGAFELVRDVVVGVDLGQSVDPTAIAVVERQAVAGRSGPAHEHARRIPAKFILRTLERLPLQMPYPAQADYVNAVLRRLPVQDVPVFMDYTGVGRPVFDIMKERRVPRLQPVTIGFAGESNHNGRHWYAPKIELVGLVQSALHRGVLELPEALPLVGAIRRELLDFRVGYSAAGNATFGARSGAHDDLILALSLALWGFGRRRPGTVDIGWAA
jgi:hypothetical protein